MIDRYKARLNQYRGVEKTLKNTLKNKTLEIESTTELLLDLEESRLIAQLIAKETQDRLTFKINDIVTGALQYVFGNEWGFKMIIKTQNNSLQAHPIFYKNGIEESPRVSEGGGVMSIASLALRVALLTLLKEPTPIILLDEPITQVGKTDIIKACELLESLSNNLKIQFLVVTHANEIANIADKTFNVEMINDVSIITEE